MTRESTQALTVANPSSCNHTVRQSHELQSQHAIGVQVALSGVAWFLAVTWLNFAGGPTLKLPITIVSGMLVMLFTLFLLVAPRWRLHRASMPCSVSHCCG